MGDDYCRLASERDTAAKLEDVMKTEIASLTSMNADLDAQNGSLAESNIILRNKLTDCEAQLENALEQRDFWKKCYAGEST